MRVWYEEVSCVRCRERFIVRVADFPHDLPDHCEPEMESVRRTGPTAVEVERMRCEMLRMCEIPI